MRLQAIVLVSIFIRDGCGPIPLGRRTAEGGCPHILGDGALSYCSRFHLRWGSGSRVWERRRALAAGMSHPCATHAQEWGNVVVAVQTLKKRLFHDGAVVVSSLPSVVVRWEQQIPHRAFGPVRNDKGLFRCPCAAPNGYSSFRRLWRWRSLGPLVKARAFGMTARCAGGSADSRSLHCARIRSASVGMTGLWKISWNPFRVWVCGGRGFPVWGGARGWAFARGLAHIEHPLGGAIRRRRLGW